MEKHKKQETTKNNNNNFKISAPKWNYKLNYQIDHILYQLFNIILSIF